MKLLQDGLADKGLTRTPLRLERTAVLGGRPALPVNVGKATFNMLAVQYGGSNIVLLPGSFQDPHVLQVSVRVCVCVFVCVCVRVRVRARVRACVRACIHVCVYILHGRTGMCFSFLSISTLIFFFNLRVSVVVLRPPCFFFCMGNPLHPLIASPQRSINSLTQQILCNMDPHLNEKIYKKKCKTICARITHQLRNAVLLVLAETCTKLHLN